MDPLKKFEQKLEQYKQQLDNLKPQADKQPEGAVFIIAELVAGISVGGILGYYLDQYFHTKVLFLLIFVILGLISSFYSIYKKYK